MIVYENTDHQFDASGYDETYTNDREHFSHRQTFEALEALFKEHIRIDRPFWCLDLGCGQGQVAAKVREIVSQRAPDMLSDSRIYGLDLSPVAIRQCEASYPDLLWINDTLQDFLKRRETRLDLFGRFDLIINKGGLLYTTSPDDYQQLMEGIGSLLGNNGLYLFIQNKKFYAKWSNRVCREWDRDIFDIAGEQFGTPSIIDNKGYLIYVYGSRSDCATSEYQSPTDEPLTIEFELNSDQTEQWFVGGDEAIADRIKFLVEDAEPAEPFIFKVPRKGGPQSQARHAELAATTAAARRAGDKTVVVSTHRFLRPDGRRGVLTPGLYLTLTGQGISAMHYPRDCLTTRDYCDSVNDWIAARPDAIMLGLGLEDYRRDAAAMVPVIELDEFTSRVDWLIWKLKRESEARIVWLWLSPNTDIISYDRRRVYRAEDAARYREAADPILLANNVHQDQIVLSEFATPERLDLPRVLQRATEAICEAVQMQDVGQ